MRYYAGIGSRETPKKKLEQMSLISIELEKRGYCLRSGGAIGADSAFEKSITNKEIFTAKSDIPQWAFDTVDKYHPKIERLDEYSRKLHARNAMILYGLENKCVDFIICWTQDGLIKGGTGQALRIAKDKGIPVYNLFYMNYKQVLVMINLMF